MRRVLLGVAFVTVAVVAYLLPRPEKPASPGTSESPTPATSGLIRDAPMTPAGAVTLLDPRDSKPPTTASALDQPTGSDPSSDPANIRPQSSENGEILWIGYRKEDFALAHGIEPEAVEIPHPPRNTAELNNFLIGTMWGWGRNPKADGAWIMFLDDNTMYGSWGHRYQYHLDSDTMEVVWAEHRTTFSKDFRYLQTEGRNARVGMLLKRADDAAFQEFLQEADGMDVILENENSVPSQE